MAKSDFLKSVTQRKNGLVNMKVVFVDIVAFSKRKSKMQHDIINKFTELTKEALMRFSQKYVNYAQQNNVNFSTDLIVIPTGDGILLPFMFEGLEKPHLDFSVELLRVISEHNKSQFCNRFDENHWCNCHPKFNIRIGIDEGQGIVFTDLKGEYNVTGNVINMANRVMSLADENIILMGETAYKNLIDMAPDVTIEDDFRCYEHIRVKHNVFLNLYQYSPLQEELKFINSKEPSFVQELEKITQMKEACTNLTQVLNPNGILTGFNVRESLERAAQVNEMIISLQKIPFFQDIINNRDIEDVSIEEVAEAMSSMANIFNPQNRRRLINTDEVHEMEKE